MDDTNATPRIMLVGKLRTGKTTVANYIASTYGFKRLAFGDALKQTANELFEGSSVYPTEYTESPAGEDEPFGWDIATKRKPRRLYQDVGQALRALDDNVWIRQVERSMAVFEDMRSTHGIVIEDGRQANEVAWAKDNGFTVIRVNANEDTRLERARKAGDLFSTDDLRHETEMYVDDVVADYDVWNDGEDIAELGRKIDEIMAEITSDKGAI